MSAKSNDQADQADEVLDLPTPNIVRIEVRPMKDSEGPGDPHFLRLVAANHEKGFRGEDSKSLSASSTLGKRWGEILDLPVWEFDIQGRRVK